MEFVVKYEKKRDERKKTKKMSGCPARLSSGLDETEKAAIQASNSYISNQMKDFAIGAGVFLGFVVLVIVVKVILHAAKKKKLAAA